MTAGAREGADGFRSPRPGGLSLAQAAERITKGYGAALAWLRDGDVLKCAWCSTDIALILGGLRCPDCGSAAALPEGWSR